jgi:hypothetical protein
MMGQADIDAETSFAVDFCVPFLVSAQNDDGGWGFHPDTESRVEPTCWALRALTNVLVTVSPECIRRGRQFLRGGQLPDGSWPASRGATTGSWVTSLACSVLSDLSESSAAVTSGLKWLCDDYPRDSSLWRRIIGRFRSGPPLAEHDDSFRGWGWTPRTSSWVEPTSFAILALRERPEEWRPATASQRCELAVSLLYDRMCPGGGWNCGNPRVYGVAGEPLVLSTAWALLAVHDLPAHGSKLASLEWLKRSYGSIQSPASLSVARIVLEAYGIELPNANQELPELFDAQEFLRTTVVVSWTALALSPKRIWFAPQEPSA